MQNEVPMKKECICPPNVPINELEKCVDVVMIAKVHIL